MTTTKNNRFANRETVVKGFIINTETQEFTPFEETVSYVRSTQKAVELVREKMDISDDNSQIIVTVNELVNEAPKPVKYNESKIYDLSIDHYDDESDAQTRADELGATVKRVMWHEYECQYWAIDDNGEYVTEHYYDDSPISFTKGEMRSFLAMSAGDFSGYKILAVHGCKKSDKPLYCVIDASELENCIER